MCNTAISEEESDDDIYAFFSLFLSRKSFFQFRLFFLFDKKSKKDKMMMY